MECLKFAFMLLHDIHDTWVLDHTISTVCPKYHKDKLCALCRLWNRNTELKKGISTQDNHNGANPEVKILGFKDFY